MIFLISELHYWPGSHPRDRRLGVDLSGKFREIFHPTRPGPAGEKSLAGGHPSLCCGGGGGGGGDGGEIRENCQQLQSHIDTLRHDWKISREITN